MKKIQYNGSSKILNGIVTKVNLIIDKLVVDVKVNGTSVIVVNEEGEREADIDLSLADQNVKQSPTTSSDNSDYRVLLSKSANDTEETDISRKDTNFKYNPSTGNLQTTKLNGNTVPSGSGNDTLAKLSDIPTIPTVNDNTITLQQNGTPVDSFTLNQNSNKTIDIKAAVNNELYTEDLNDVKTVGFYVGRSGNTCTNKPSGVNQFGLYVVKLGTSNQYFKQILIQPRTVANGGSKTYSRALYQTTWTDWVEETYTDEKVKQTAVSSSSNENYRLLLSKSASNTEETDGVQKSGSLYYNPYDDKVTVQNVDISNTANIATAKVTSLITSQYYFNLGSGSAVAMLEANSASTTSNPTFVTLPASSGTLALRSELPTNPVLWSENNWLGAKNMLPTPYYADPTTLHGVTFNYNSDGSISLSGRATARYNIWLRYYGVGRDPFGEFWLPNGTYKLTGGVSENVSLAVTFYKGTTWITQANDTGSGATFTVDSSSTIYNNIGCVLQIQNGTNVDGITIYPMIRLASIVDSTFEPYAQTNRQLTLAKQSWEDNMASGVKNYFPYPFEIHPKQGEVYTQRGIRWTDGGNGIIVANGINDNTGNSYSQLLPTSETSGGTNIRFCTLPAGKYHFSGGISEDYYLNLSTGLKTAPTDRTAIGDDTGNGFDFEVTEAMAQNNMFCSFAFVKKGKSATNVQYKPMITRYEDSSVGFAEYAMTNKELTQFKTDMLTIATTETSGTASRAYAKNELMFWRRGLYRVTQAISSGGSITLNTNVVATTLSDEIRAIRDALNI